MLLLLLTSTAQAHAEPTWTSVPLVGGRTALLPTVGLAPDLPRAMVIGEIVRAVYAARDPHSRLATALARYFRTPPPDGDEAVPLPMPPEFWRAHVVGHSVSDREMLGAILSDRRAALLCYGLLGLDAETRAYVMANPTLVSDMDDRDASAFASFAGVIRVRDGALDLPGGATAEAAWTSLLGTSPKKTSDAIRSLLATDSGRLALFAEALWESDARHAALVLQQQGPDNARVAAARAAYRGFAVVDQARNLSDLTFQRVPYGPDALLGLLPPGPSGTIDGPEDYWHALLENDVVPAKGVAEWDAFDLTVSTTPASVLDRFAQESLPGRHEILNMVSFVSRLAVRFPNATWADRVFFGHAFRRYPALLLTLERIGVDDLGVWHALVHQALTLDVNAGASAEVDIQCALLQSPIALIDRAVQVGTITPREATTLLSQLAEIEDPGTAETGHEIGSFMIESLLPAFGASGQEDGTAETTLVEALSGLRPAPSTSPAPRRSIRWEDFDYRVDPAAAEMVRLREVRSHLGGNTLDTALALVRAETALARSPAVESRRAAARWLARAQPALESIDEDERPIPASLDALKVVQQAAADAARPGSTPANLTIGERLSKVQDAVLADTLTSFVYAIWIGDPDGQLFLGGNVARRHDFGRRSTPPAERDRARWMIPEETSSVGEPWHVRGALLALDVGLGRLALRRTSGDLPSRQPRINESDRRALVTSLVLMPFADADQSAADRLVGWLSTGTQVAASLSDRALLDAAIDRLGLDERRAAIIRWTTIEDPGNLSRLFLLTELAMLGRPAGVPMPDDRGPAATARIGCLCRRFPDPPLPHRLSTLSTTGTVASVIDDLELQVLRELDALHLPSALAKGVTSAALQDYLDNARPAYAGDWWTLGELARTLSHERVIDYVSALTAGGPLVPASPDGAAGHP